MIDDSDSDRAATLNFFKSFQLPVLRLLVLVLVLVLVIVLVLARDY